VSRTVKLEDETWGILSARALSVGEEINEVTNKAVRGYLISPRRYRPWRSHLIADQPSRHARHHHETLGGRPFRARLQRLLAR
jgi:hypothetical protein